MILFILFFSTHNNYPYYCLKKVTAFMRSCKRSPSVFIFPPQPDGNFVLLRTQIGELKKYNLITGRVQSSDRAISMCKCSKVRVQHGSFLPHIVKNTFLSTSSRVKCFINAFQPFFFLAHPPLPPPTQQQSNGDKLGSMLDFGPHPHKQGPPLLLLNNVTFGRIQSSC